MRVRARALAIAGQGVGDQLPVGQGHGLHQAQMQVVAAVGQIEAPAQFAHIALQGEARAVGEVALPQGHRLDHLIRLQPGRQAGGQRPSTALFRGHRRDSSPPATSASYRCGWENSG